jgi:hypothetical protein
MVVVLERLIPERQRMYDVNGRIRHEHRRKGLLGIMTGSAAMPGSAATVESQNDDVPERRCRACW